MNVGLWCFFQNGSVVASWIHSSSHQGFPISSVNLLPCKKVTLLQALPWTGAMQEIPSHRNKIFSLASSFALITKAICIIGVQMKILNMKIHLWGIPLVDECRAERRKMVVRFSQWNNVRANLLPEYKCCEEWCCRMCWAIRTSWSFIIPNSYRQTRLSSQWDASTCGSSPV